MSLFSLRRQAVYPLAVPGHGGQALFTTDFVEATQCPSHRPSGRRSMATTSFGLCIKLFDLTRRAHYSWPLTQGGAQ